MNGTISVNTMNRFLSFVDDWNSSSIMVINELWRRLFGTILSIALFGKVSCHMVFECSYVLNDNSYRTRYLHIMHLHHDVIDHASTESLPASVLLQSMFDIRSQFCSRNLKLRKTRWATWYTLATIAMFTSTSIYSAFILRNTFTIASIATYAGYSTDSAIKSVQRCVYNGEESCTGDSELSTQGAGGPNLGLVAIYDIPREYCVGTAALTTNVC